MLPALMSLSPTRPSTSARHAPPLAQVPSKTRSQAAAFCRVPTNQRARAPAFLGRDWVGVTKPRPLTPCGWLASSEWYCKQLRLILRAESVGGCADIECGAENCWCVIIWEQICMRTGIRKEDKKVWINAEVMLSACRVDGDRRR